MTDPRDLETVFGSLANAVPCDLSSEEDYVFRRQNLPTPPNVVESDRIIVRKMIHDYNGWQRVDQLVMRVDADVARQLALFLLSCVFHRPARSELVLLNDLSQIRTVVYRSRGSSTGDPPVGLTVAPLSFRYLPSATKKHPWCEDRHALDLPLLALSTRTELANSDEEWEGRNTVFVESSLAGTVRLAELLLNASCRGNSVLEYELECDAGFRGVAPMSAELRILLPGSDGWDSQFAAAR